MSDWISVKDRLPKMYEHVLVFSPITGIENDFRAFEESPAEYCFYQSGRVTHWMPLPEKPSADNVPMEYFENEEVGVE